MDSPLEAMAGELERCRLVAIVRLVDHTHALDVVGALCDAGVTFVELTVERPEGFDSLERAVATYGHRATIGAGTVLSVGDLDRAFGLGARFIVTPNTDPAVIERARARDVLALPGAFTATEVATAVAAGAPFVKLFPASVGVGYLRALRGPFPRVRFVPTGGVAPENATEWFDAGAAAVAMGSNLVASSGSLEGLLERARVAVAACAR